MNIMDTTPSQWNRKQGEVQGQTIVVCVLFVDHHCLQHNSLIIDKKFYHTVLEKSE